VFQQGFMGVAPNPRKRYIPSGEGYTLAARITGPAPVEAEPAEPAKKDAEKKDAAKKDQKPRANLNVIAIADLDMIGSQFFGLRNNKEMNLDLDNIPFVLNCVDVLAGDDSVVSLRKKRSKHYTLKRLEDQSAEFFAKLEDETKKAKDESEKAMKEAQKGFDKQVELVQNNPDLDERSKETQLANMQSVAQRRLDVQKAIIEDQEQSRIRESRADLEQKTRQIQNTVRFVSAALPPLPPLILGLIIWVVRRMRENLGANPKRLA
jgi:ABC-2 type transport system permease protein